MKRLIVSVLSSVSVLIVTPVLFSSGKQAIDQQLVEEDPAGPVARSGCCSWHGGVCGCNYYGRVECCDGTTSSSCTCNAPTPERPLGLQEGDCDTGITLAQGTTYARPYVRSDGTYVQGHYRTAPDNTRLNNWSTQGNSNPYTGQKGYRDPYPSIYDTAPSRNRDSLYDSDYLNDD